ncbi:hypothetical protein ACFP65_01595 [Marinilactibacillus sp. GCM10026970]|uniref:hypothetical protein n=1 Tax=Marinilactibacillus sp. GCM10026970 TaxID=3252642 RepID=UPI00360C005D
MKFDSKEFNKLLDVTLIISVLCILIGFFLWMIFVPIPDIELSSAEELRVAHREAALNYPLGRFLLYVGWTGLSLWAAGFIARLVQKIKMKKQKK